MGGRVEDAAVAAGGAAGPVEILISAVVNPSEDEARVRRAMLALFPDAALEAKGHGLEGWSRLEGAAYSLDVFAELLARHRIRDAARAVMIRGSKGHEERSVFHLNKQAALSGRVNFAGEDVVLGPITVEIRGPGLMPMIDGMTLHD